MYVVVYFWSLCAVVVVFCNFWIVILAVLKQIERPGRHSARYRQVSCLTFSSSKGYSLVVTTRLFPVDAEPQPGRGTPGKEKRISTALWAPIITRLLTVDRFPILIAFYDPLCERFHYYASNETRVKNCGLRARSLNVDSSVAQRPLLTFVAKTWWK